MIKPVTILTGFLGAGKTTFLNAVISAKPNTRLAVIENEIGKEGIDADLVLKQADEDLFEMNNGCLCCSLNDNLIELLIKIQKQSERFDELIIETTGIADPAGVAGTFWQVPGMENYYAIQRVICLVDGEFIEDQLKETREAIDQISFSDVILINKTDKIREGYLQELKTLIKELNPLALVLEGHHENYPIDEIWSHFRGDFKAATVEKTKEYKHGEIKALSFRFDEAFDLETFQNKLLVFLMFNAGRVYRLKGILWGIGYDSRVVAQSVRSSLALTGARPWEAQDKRESRITIIGNAIDKEEIRKLLESCLAKNVNSMFGSPQ